MTDKLHGESFVIVGKLNEVDWTTSTATLHTTEGPPKRVDLSRTLSAKKILQAQKREYRVKGRIIISFVDNSESTYVEELEDLEVAPRATKPYEPEVLSGRQLRILDDHWHSRFSKLYYPRSPIDILVMSWLILAGFHMVVYIQEFWPDAGAVLTLIAFGVFFYVPVFGGVCIFWYILSIHFAIKVIYRNKYLRYNRVAGGAALLIAFLPPYLVVIGVLYGVIVHNWHCAVMVCGN